MSPGRGERIFRRAAAHAGYNSGPRPSAVAMLLRRYAAEEDKKAMQQKPQISVAPTRVKSGENVMLTGAGFSANRSAMSHLRRPNETEYNPIRLRINDRGEISHKIDTVMLDEGTFEVWVEDETSKSVSNRVRFNVESSFTHP